MKTFLSLCALLLLSACASQGTKFEMSDVNSMKPGSTTYEQAVEKLGKPRAVAMNADGSKSATWIWAQAGAFVGTQSRGVKILFDKDGKMIRIAGKVGDQVD